MTPDRFRLLFVLGFFVCFFLSLSGCFTMALHDDEPKTGSHYIMQPDGERLARENKEYLQRKGYLSLLESCKERPIWHSGAFTIKRGDPATRVFFRGCRILDFVEEDYLVLFLDNDGNLLYPGPLGIAQSTLFDDFDFDGYKEIGHIFSATFIDFDPQTRQLKVVAHNHRTYFFFFLGSLSRYTYGYMFTFLLGFFGMIVAILVSMEPDGTIKYRLPLIFFVWLLTMAAFATPSFLVDTGISKVFPPGVNFFLTLYRFGYFFVYPLAAMVGLYVWTKLFMKGCRFSDESSRASLWDEQ